MAQFSHWCKCWASTWSSTDDICPFEDLIVPEEHALTVCAARDEEKPYEEQIGIQGRKATVPYGLYVCHGFISANLAQQTGFSEEDLELFWDALKTCSM